MQVKAIASATAELKKQGLDPKPEIMIPLVAFEEELALVREVVEENIKAVSEEYGVELDIPVATMIEIPRAAITSEDIAKHADFFSFGTNDLTQMGLGFSRDDVEAAFMPLYLDKKIVKTNPFATLDKGVAKLVQMGVEGGPQGQPRHRLRRLRRDRRRPGVHPHVLRPRPRLRVPARRTACPSRASRPPRPRSSPTAVPRRSRSSRSSRTS